MSDIRPVYMQQSGPLPGLTGWFSGGQTVMVDFDTMTVVDTSPLMQRAYDASPLVQPSSETAPLPEVVTPSPELTPEVHGDLPLNFTPSNGEMN